MFPITKTENEILIEEVSEEEFIPKFQYMKNLIRASELINMWPKKTLSHHLVVWLTIVYSVLFILTFFLRIVMEGGNMDGITEAVDFITVFISATFRFMYVYVRGDKYLLLVHLIHTKFVHSAFFSNKNNVSLLKYYNIANRIIVWYGCFTYFWILQICLVPFISYIWEVVQSGEEDLFLETNSTEPRQEVPYPVAMQAYVPFDVSKQPANSLFYLYQIIGFLTFGSIYLVVDSFWYMVIFLTIGQFVLIKESLVSITEGMKGYETSAEINLLDESEAKEVENALTKCIKHHQFVREFVRMIDDIFNPNILVDSLHAIISIAFILLDVTIAINKGNWKKALYSLEYFTTSITHMYCFDWLGNELAVKEEELAETIYAIPWFKYPKLKIKLLLLTIQSRRPYKLTGGRMYKLSLEFFTSTVKAIFSYFTFLVQIRNETPSAVKTIT